jgi:pSer/pThr/pTyr-binding forkhead associated (FHA) protein
MLVKLRVVSGKPAGKTVLFRPGDYFLGRGPECHLRFNSDWVSRQHCLLRVSEQGASLRDLGSRNGTLINGRLSDGEQVLKAGDQVQVGPVVFEVTIERDAPAEPAPLDPFALQPEGEQLRDSVQDSTDLYPSLGDKDTD